MSTDHSEGMKCDLQNNSKKISRRDFLGLSALWSCIAAWTLTTIGLCKFPLPALLPDISSILKIGKPEEIPIGGEKIYDEKKVLVMRDEKGVRAVSLICTHLGCIVSKSETGGFICPCHGSKFDKKGSVMAGPAPKGLNWLEVSQLPNGKLVVDMNKVVSKETAFVV